jgi:hypothetical protein
MTTTTVLAVCSLWIYSNADVFEEALTNCYVCLKLCLLDATRASSLIEDNLFYPLRVPLTTRVDRTQFHHTLRSSRSLIEMRRQC